MAKLLFISFNTICFGLCQTLCIFALWIEWSCKPLDKGKLTAFPRLNIVSINLKMSDMLKFEELPKINSERWLLLKDFEGEVWKDVVGYEGLYEVSNYGRIKALGRMRKTHHNGLAQIKDRIIRNIKSGMSFGVVEIDEQNNIINRYVSIRHAAKILHTNANRFSKWCKQGGGVWKNGKIYKMLEVYDR